MRYHLFAPEKEVPRYKIALLVKTAAFNKTAVEQNYVFPLLAAGIAAEDIIAFTLEYDEKGKAPAAHIKSYLNTLLPVLDSMGVEFLYVADANYFKPLTKQARAEPHFGYVLPCLFPGFEHLKCVLGLNHQALIYDPNQQPKLDLSINTLISAVQGNFSVLGADIIHSECYPETVSGVAQALERLHSYPELTCDIEAFSLRHWLAGVGTIAFAWDKHNGVAFPCDYTPLPEKNAEGEYGFYRRNDVIRNLLRKFFESYTGKLTFHNSGYDCKVLIYTLWMRNLGDTEGLLTGLEVVTRSLDDTKLIAYLATNTTAGNVLGLKPLAHEFAGNWAKDDIKDIRRIPLGELLRYNLVDTLSTWYVKEKLYPVMVADRQEDLYKGLFMDSAKLILQLELTGMPMSAKRIQEVRQELEGIQQKQANIIDASPAVQKMNLQVQIRAMEAANAKLKTKQHPLSKFADLKFNPNSGPQLQVLLYELMGLPVIDYTDTKQPATGADTLEKLVNHTSDPDHQALLKALIAHSKVVKILSTFIPAFESGVAKAEDGIIWLFGSFNLGGTVSGRLSSSDPNLQNIPAGSFFGKLIKSIFMGPPGWLFAGADFNALEARIDALTTKDKNKLAIYIDGMDSHSFNALSYWPEKMPNISSYLTQERLAEQHYRVEYSDGSFDYLPESVINANP